MGITRWEKLWITKSLLGQCLPITVIMIIGFLYPFFLLSLRHEGFIRVCTTIHYYKQIYLKDQYPTCIYNFAKFTLYISKRYQKKDDTNPTLVTWNLWQWATWHLVLWHLYSWRTTMRTTLVNLIGDLITYSFIATTLWRTNHIKTNFFLHHVFMPIHVPSKNSSNMKVDRMVVFHMWPRAVENNDLGSLVIMVDGSHRNPCLFLKALIIGHILKWDLDWDVVFLMK